MTSSIEKTITATELSSQLSSVLDRVDTGEEFVVTRHGRPVAVLSPPGLRDAAGAGESAVRESRAAYAARGATPALSGDSSAGLMRLIGSGATRSVLALFVREPDAQLYQRAIARRAGVGLRSAQIALDRLEGLGIVESRRDGNRRYYRAVRTGRFEDLRALLSRDIGVAEVIRRHLVGTGVQVSWAFIFGSVAEGTDTLGSDIDLAVVGDTSADELAAPIADAQRELGREIDVVSFLPDEFAAKRSSRSHFVIALLEGARIDVIGGPDDA